ncbi:ATP-grasp domain-containing protein [Desulfovibrio psychrotolerans]|uniref:Carbamoyl phosphate synthase n=1 Tax=Desulfovibrio psychrotolerans TaxID=415242 RepID=A0A7J0BXW8_9BACT|nr:ATP-grasp domain-containing protein [Desulfovibrio psychrotolerans]GFM38547.1 carbamoyl phosphate synthase [Desulfovibrio psychrotolerans]
MISPIPVCVTGVGGASIGEQIVKALRAAQTPYHIIGTDSCPHSTGFGLVNVPATLPPARAADYIEQLVSLCKKHRVQALFPGSEAELVEISRNRNVFRDMGIFLPINPSGVITACLDKVATFEMLSGKGFCVPWYVRVRSEEQAASFASYPVVFKPSTGGGGSVDTVIVQNKEEASLFARFLLKTYPEFIAQEYVGTAAGEYTVGILSDMNGTFLNSIAVHRNLNLALSRRLRVPNRTERRELGDMLVISSGISQGAIGPYPEVTATCEEIATSIGSAGPLNIQCRYFDNKVWVFEINPRFSGTTSLRALVGFNEPDCLIRRHVLNEDIPVRFAYNQGIVMRRLEETFLPEEQNLGNSC